MTRPLLVLSSLAIGFTALVASSAPVAAAAAPVCPEGGITTFEIDGSTGSDAYGNADVGYDVSWEIDGDGNITVAADVTLGAEYYITQLGYTGTFQGNDSVVPAVYLFDVGPTKNASHTFAPAIGQIDITEVHVSAVLCPTEQQPTTTETTTTTIAGSGGSATTIAGSGGTLPSTGGGSSTAWIAVALLGLGGAVTLMVRRPRTHA